MHKKTKIYRVKKGEKCLKPLPHHMFTPPGNRSVADENCLIVIPHCSEQTGVIISDSYLEELGYFFQKKKEFPKYKEGDIYPEWESLKWLYYDAKVDVGDLLVWADETDIGMEAGVIVKVMDVVYNDALGGGNADFIDGNDRQWYVGPPFARLPK